MAEPIVVMSGIEKQFPGVHALQDARFELYPGEIHALIGENGAGKSTLMKVLSGVYQKDAGRICVDGAEVSIPNPRAALALRIAIIHQELTLMPHLTAAQNIYIGHEPRAYGGLFLDEKQLNNNAAAMFELLKLSINPEVRVGDLTVASQQMVEIVKALTYDARVLIMDEPTAALNDKEIEELFDIIRKLKAKGVGIIYISHRMDELFRISDRITVMRDGQYIATLAAAETNLDEIIKLMVGRTLFESSETKGTDFNGTETVLDVRNVSRGKLLKNVSFKAYKGEILGFAGLMGAGRTELARAVFGADPVDSGEIFVKGTRVYIKHPKDAVKHGIGYLSEDRKRFGVAVGLDVETNVGMASMKQFTAPGGFIKKKYMHDIACKYVEQLAIKTPTILQRLKFLSGGNQQKVVIAKWLCRNCDILFFDEPTRGIDVGAKHEIYKLLTSLASQGKTIIMISSELPEVLRMSNRIIVMCEGRITGELSAREATQEKIMQLATLRETMVGAAKE